MEYVQEQNMRLNDSVYVGEDYEMPQPEISKSPNTVFNPQLQSRHSLQLFESYRPTSGNQFDKFKENAVNQRDVEVSLADRHFPSYSKTQMHPHFHNIPPPKLMI